MKALHFLDGYGQKTVLKKKKKAYWPSHLIPLITGSDVSTCAMKTCFFFFSLLWYLVTGMAASATAPTVEAQKQENFDKQTLLAVLQFLRKSNLKVTVLFRLL